MWPPRYLLRTIEALSIPHRQSGASSRGPWSSAELAPRPVRRGRSKPQKNALDSRKMRGMQSWIPGVGRGLKEPVAGGVLSGVRARDRWLRLVNVSSLKWDQLR